MADERECVKRARWQPYLSDWTRFLCLPPSIPRPTLVPHALARLHAEELHLIIVRRGQEQAAVHAERERGERVRRLEVLVAEDLAGLERFLQT